jgi:hypothetical protein
LLKIDYSAVTVTSHKKSGLSGMQDDCLAFNKLVLVYDLISVKYSINFNKLDVLFFDVFDGCLQVSHV